MSLGKELLELLITILPVLITIGPFLLPIETIARWVTTVIVTASTSLLTTGLLLMRSLSTCFDVTPTCASDQSPVNRIPGLFERYPDCLVCIPNETMTGTFSIAQALNKNMLSVALAAWIVCSLVSVVTIARFIAWSKAQRDKAATPKPQ